MVPRGRGLPVQWTDHPGGTGPISIHPDTAHTAETAAAAIDDKKGLDIVLLDVSKLLVITDLFVIATGTSRRHILTLAEEAEAKLKEIGRRPLRREGLDDATWVLLDYGDVVVHVFDEATRSFYDLERLWGDAPRRQYEQASSV
jgi:ribosome-associated protein